MVKLVLIIGGAIVVLILLFNILKYMWDNSRNGIIGKAYNPPEILPSICEIQEQIVKNGGAIIVDGKLSPKMEEEWNKIVKVDDTNTR